MEYYLDIKKKALAICNNMDGPRGCYAKWHKPDRERQALHDFTYMQNLKNKANKHNRTEAEL